MTIPGVTKLPEDPPGMVDLEERLVMISRTIPRMYQSDLVGGLKDAGDQLLNRMWTLANDLEKRIDQIKRAAAAELQSREGM